MTILINSGGGKSSAVNLSNHSWDTEIVPGDDSKVRMILDDKRTFVLAKDKYEEILSILTKTDKFMEV